MKKFAATDEPTAAYKKLMEAQDAFEAALGDFESEAVTAIDDIANHTGKPVWHKNAVGTPYAGEATGYMFDYDPDEEMFDLVGLICENDAGEKVEVHWEDVSFSEPTPCGGA